MKTGWMTHELYMWHNTQNWNLFFPPSLTVQQGEHAENPETKRRFRNLVEASGLLDHLVPIKPRSATEEELLRFHTQAHVRNIETLSAGGLCDMATETAMGYGSFEIAKLAVGGVIESFDAVLSGRVDNAYALCRPPGHHALAHEAMGFCLFANAVLGIEHARKQHGVTRIAVVDWDVHHGNGTQDAYYGDPNVLTISLHQDNLFPTNSGAQSETGVGSGVGANVNIPLPAGSGEGAYLAAMDQIVLPALAKFQPELIVVACGFDASAMDPLGHMMLSSDSYRKMTLRILDAADRLCQGRVVMTHEGGYSAAYVPYCGLAVLEEMSGHATGLVDPFVSHIAAYGGQSLQPHQRDVIDKIAALI